MVFNQNIILRKFRAFIIVLLPFAVFGLTYSLMNFLPNYQVNPIDTEGTYLLEKHLFPVFDKSANQILIPSEYCQAHHVAWLDIMSGLFYLLWVPLPISFAIYLYVRGFERSALRFSAAFLFVNLVGFIGYYVHPAAPPWYVMKYGFIPNVNTPGNVAGFEYFDALTHTHIFHSLYAKNANVFAAIPSLHAAYNPIALYYAVRFHEKKWGIALAIVSIGICFSAVYSSHHYIIDVTLGLLTTILGIILYEGVLLRLPFMIALKRHLKGILS